MFVFEQVKHGILSIGFDYISVQDSRLYKFYARNKKLGIRFGYFLTRILDYGNYHPPY